ncbi:phosphatidylinositol 4-kinase [Hamiltosporidium tvaerminnensis]|uniref:Phosphatidylinositol 4-kinase n=3 Tax=Hamiltosporidium TaxID=1176354 RepID=A0A4Q9LFR3_9MICR|nr:phosphatidylinositol 4-kinase [Hamiltosporidium tvaerminnensis]TBU06889.1 phosphatidylinositol 4-kinase [Hamiltosporidium magnivora]
MNGLKTSKTEETKMWLHRLFNSSYFNTWMVVSYLYRYPSTGIQYYLCKKLEYKKDVLVVLPELVHIFFFHTEDIVSLPIYNLFLFHSKKSRKFCLSLYFLLKTYLGTLETEQNKLCILLIGEIYECDSLREEREKCKRKLIFNPISSFLKYLDCKNILFKNLIYNHLNGYNYLSFKTIKIPKVELIFPNLKGILFYFVKSISWIISDSLFNCLKDYEKIFSNKRFRFKERGRKSRLFYGKSFEKKDLTSNISFFEELIEISKRLKYLHKNMRQKGLEIEIGLVNYNLPAKIYIPFLPTGKYILRILLDHSYILDSAENSPYLIVLEIADEYINRNEIISEETRNVAVILNQLTTLEITKKYEANIIKQKIIENLQNISQNKLYMSSWSTKRETIKSQSVYSNLRGWNIKSMIVKTGNDLRQEMIASQLLTEMINIWKEEKLDIWVLNYGIYLIGSDCGFIETITDAYSIHAIKKRNISKKKSYFLKSYFLTKYGPEHSGEYKRALRNFLISLVGYSLATYILQIKDRHNGNILIGKDGHIIHIDFGFILGDHPGFYRVETAPFKISREYCDLLGNLVNDFKSLFLEGFLSLRKYNDRLCRIIEIMMEKSKVKCLNKNSLIYFRERFKLDLGDKEIEKYVVDLINWSFNSMSTGLYDSYQYFSHGYLK